jgi:hypothetical protein
LSLLAWCALAVFYSNLPGETLRIGIAALLALGWTSALIFGKNRGKIILGFLVCVGLIALWWMRIPASNDRSWQPEVAVLPHATIEGNRVTMHNIRNFEYRSETDFTPHYYDKTFDLQKLDSVDLIAVHWMGPDIAHLFLSFGFEGMDYLAISIETRKEVGEPYSTVEGIFKQYELYYVVADERDVIRVRTNYRKDPPEQVYLYRLHASTERAKRVFLDYLAKINSLHTQPEFYNSLITNCTTNILMHSRVNPGSLPFSWKILLSGHAAEYIYDNGGMGKALSFPELQERSLINAVAQRADTAPDFSQRIRAGLPGMDGQGKTEMMQDSHSQP